LTVSAGGFSCNASSDHTQWSQHCRVSNAEVSLYERPSNSVSARSGDLAFTVGESMPYSSYAAVDLFDVLLFLASIQVICDYGRRRRLYPPGPRPLPIIWQPSRYPDAIFVACVLNFFENTWYHRLFCLQRFLSDKNGREYIGFPYFWAGYRRLEHRKSHQRSPRKRSAIYSDRPVMPFYEMCVLESFGRGFRLNYNQDGLALGIASCEKRRPLASRTQGA